MSFDSYSDDSFDSSSFESSDSEKPENIVDKVSNILDSRGIKPTEECLEFIKFFIESDKLKRFFNSPLSGRLALISRFRSFYDYYLANPTKTSEENIIDFIFSKSSNISFHDLMFDIQQLITDKISEPDNFDCFGKYVQIKGTKTIKFKFLMDGEPDNESRNNQYALISSKQEAFNACILQILVDLFHLFLAAHEKWNEVRKYWNEYLNENKRNEKVRSMGNLNEFGFLPLTDEAKFVRNLDNGILSQLHENIAYAIDALLEGTVVEYAPAILISYIRNIKFNLSDTPLASHLKNPKKSVKPKA